MRDITNEAPPSGAVSSGAVVTHGPAAEAAAPLVEMLLGAVPVRLELWDGTSVGQDGETCTIRLRSPDALRRARYAERRGGKECVSKCRFRLSTDHSKSQQIKTI